MEIRDEPEQNEIRSVTETHQFNAYTARKKPKEGRKKYGKFMIPRNVHSSNLFLKEYATKKRKKIDTYKIMTLIDLS